MKTIERTKLSKFFNLLLLYGLIIYTFIMLSRAIYLNYELKKESENIRREIAQIEKRNQDLRNLIIYYQSSSFREVEARKKLGLKKPGEKVVMIPQKTTPNFQNEQTQEQQNIRSSETTVTQPNWQLWWQYFFN